MSEITQDHRRACPRYDLSISLRFATFQDDKDESILESAETADISRTGLQLSLHKPIPLPSYLLLLGKSVWCRPEEGGLHRAGVQFLGHIDSAFFDFLDGAKL
jgi:hypothetical protein